MSTVIPVLRRLSKLLWSCFAWITVLTAVLLVSARLLLPLAGHYKEEMVRAAGQSLGRPLHVKSLETEWHGLGPVIVLNGVELLDKPGGRTVLSFDRARVGIDLLASLLHRRLEDSNVTVTGVAITLTRRRDGRLGIEGFGTVATGGERGRENLEQIQSWLQAQRHITLARSDIYWHGVGRDGAPLHFSRVNLTLSNKGRLHELSGSVSLPAMLGKAVEVAVSFQGPLLRVDRWSGDVYVKGSALNLPRLFGHRDYAGIGVTEGTADLRAWGRADRGGLEDMEGDARIAGLRLVRAAAGDGDRPAAVDLKGLSGRFHWRRHGQGWTLDADRFRLAEGDEVTPETRFRISKRPRGDETEITAQAGSLRLEDAAELVNLADKAVPALHELINVTRPTGTLRDAYLRLDLAPGKPARPYVHLRFADVATRAPWHGLPAVSGLQGVVDGSPSAGVVELNSRSMSVAKGNMLRGTVSVDRLGARISWRRSGASWQVSSPGLHLQNPDVTVDARFTVTGGGSRPGPFVDLVADVRNGVVAHASRYLPAAKMRPRAVEWLDHALVKGTIASGAVLLHGNLSDFPFDHHKGVFEVRLNIDDAILDFSRRWPRIEEIAAEVSVDGRSLAVDGAQGKMLNSTITRVRARIGDLAGKPAVLTLQGAARGPTRDALYIATNTPLKQKLGKYLKDATVGGRSTLSLSMRFPLAPVPKEVRGRLTFTDGILVVGDKIRLTQVNGPLAFTGKGLSSGGIKARLVGYPATITAGTEERGDARVIYFDARGRTDVRHIRQLKYLHLPFLKYVDGRTQWRGRLRLRELPRNKRTQASLEIHSGLQGMSVDMPAPMAKGKQETVPLTVKVDRLGQPSMPVSFRYGDRLSGAFLASKTGTGRGIERGEFQFGGGEAHLPPGEGIYLSGKLDRFDLAKWREHFPGHGAAGGEGPLERVTGIDVHIGSLQSFGWDLHKVSLQGRKGAKGWSVKVHSDEVAGTAELPLEGAQPAMLDLDYLHLHAGALQGKGHEVDPTRLPPLRMSSKEVTYDGKPFGDLKLTLTRRPRGVHVDKLSVDSEVMQISATGDWTKDAQGQTSAFEANVTTNDIGETLSRFGYVGTIKGGRGTVQLTAAWSGSPTHVDMKTLDGSLSLNLSKGRLLNVDPGAGRILGILSLQALPRRLTLDFSDLFEKGFSFDSMAGDFSIRDGNAYTDNLVMKGPSARVDVIGRVGLVSRDYDQTVTVTPHLTGSLPIAGAIASGVGVGVAILLLQKIFENQIDEMTRVRYTIKGPWKKPVVQRAKKGGKSGNGHKS